MKYSAIKDQQKRNKPGIKQISSCLGIKLQTSQNVNLEFLAKEDNKILVSTKSNTNALETDAFYFTNSTHLSGEMTCSSRKAFYHIWQCDASIFAIKGAEYL